MTKLPPINDLKEILPIADGIFDFLEKYDVPPLDGLVALAYCLGVATGTLTRWRGLSDVEAQTMLTDLSSTSRPAMMLGRHG